MITIDEHRCPQDHPCPLVFHCPAQAISQQGFGLPVIDQEKCTHCGLCLRGCPYRAMQQTEREPVAV